MTDTDKGNKEALWMSATNLAEYAYSLLGDLPEEERWDMVSKMRQHAFNIADSIAAAVGSRHPRDRMHYYLDAVRHLYGLKNVLTMAKRVNYIKPEPEQMIVLEDLIQQARAGADSAEHDIQDYLNVFAKQSDDKVDPS